MTASSDAEQPAQAGEQRSRLDVLRGIADHMVSRLADGRLQWDAWLEEASRHGRYGFTNTLLIVAQRPSATDVRSYDAWQKAGRQVRRGETALRIFSARGKLRAVFDIEQTDGEAIEEELPPSSDGLDRLTRLASDLGFYVDRGQGWTYLGGPRRRIPVAPELDDTTAAALLAHQLAHALHPGDHIDTVSASSPFCHGVRRVFADSVTYLVLADLGLDVSQLSFAPPRRWAGTDARANPAGAVRAVGEQIVRTSTRLRRRLHDLAESAPHTSGAEVTMRPGRPQRSPSPIELNQQPPEASTSRLRAALADAHEFFRQALPGSWGVGYLASRGFTPAIQERWEVGFAPRARHSLVEHLRKLGHSDQTLLEAGLAKQRDSGGIFDLFRDRVLFPLRDSTGEAVGFIGRRRDDAPGPKYLNTPETELFRKSEILFGLYEGRPQLVGGGRPLLVEGPLDAIAVNTALPDTYAAVAPCGTAITTEQVKRIGDHTDLGATGLVLALDGDPAGRAGAIRAWRTLRHVAGPIEVAVLPEGRDPAELLSPTGETSVREALLSVTQLADLVIDEKIQRFGGALEFVESRFAAAKAAAPLIADLPPEQTARQIARVAAATGMDPSEVTNLVVSVISSNPAPGTPLSPPRSSGHSKANTDDSARTAPAKRTHRRTA